jgi:hypothetical protein
VDERDGVTPRADIERLEDVAVELAQRYDGAVSETEIYRRVFETYSELRRHATVHDHLVPLAAHLVREALRTRSDGGTST